MFKKLTNHSNHCILLWQALELLGTELSKEEVIKLVEELDEDGSGELDFEVNNTPSHPPIRILEVMEACHEENDLTACCL